MKNNLYQNKETFKKISKKIFYILLSIFAITVFVGIISVMVISTINISKNTNNQSKVSQQSMINYETIDVTVVSNKYKYWYASGSHFYTKITVKSEDGLEQTFELEGMDATKYKDCQEGDVVQAQLCVWRNNSGEIIKREIDCLE